MRAGHETHGFDFLESDRKTLFRVKLVSLAYLFSSQVEGGHDRADVKK